MLHQAAMGDSRTASKRFVSRIHRMRMLGAVLCALPIASVLEERGAGAITWFLLALNAFVWPQVAHWFCLRSGDPVRAQFRCLSTDSLFGGVWIAAMALSTAPSALFVTMLTADKFAVGGSGLLWKSTLALLAGFIATWWLLGFPFDPAVSQRTQLACIPFLFIYAVALSFLTDRLGRKIKRQNQELERLARTDPATGLANKRYFRERAVEEMSRSRRSGRPVSLLLIDIDRFKKINDSYGHGMGDIALTDISQALHRHVRDVDLPARYGGDELALLLVDTDAGKAATVAERLRLEVSELEFPAEPGMRCSLSIGLAALVDEYQTVDQWIQAADMALYRAKAAGRNRVAYA